MALDGNLGANALKHCLNDRKLFEDIVECLFREAETLVDQSQKALGTSRMRRPWAGRRIG